MAESRRVLQPPTRARPLFVRDFLPLVPPLDLGWWWVSSDVPDMMRRAYLRCGLSTRSNTTREKSLSCVWRYEPHLGFIVDEDGVIGKRRRRQRRIVVVVNGPTPEGRIFLEGSRPRQPGKVGPYVTIKGSGTGISFPMVLVGVTCPSLV